MKAIRIAIAIVILTVCVITTSVLAQSELSASIDAANNVSVSILTNEAMDSKYMLYIFEPGYSLKNFADVVNRELNGLFKLEQLTAGKKINESYSVFEYSFTMDAIDKKGEYTVIAAGGDFAEAAEARTQYFVFTESSVLANALAAINGATAASLEGILTQYQSTAWHIDFNNAFYQSQKNIVLENFESMVGGFNSGGAVETAFLQACALAELRYAAKDDIFKTFAKYERIFGIEYSSGITEKDSYFLNAFTALKNVPASNPIKNTGELAAVIKKADALNAVNKAGRDSIIAVIRKYNDLFNIDFNGDFTRVDSYEVAKQITATGEGYTSLEQMAAAFNSAVSSLIPSSSSVGGSVVGGGGGGGSSGGGGANQSSFGITGSDFITEQPKEIIENLSPETFTFNDIDNAEWAKLYIDYLNHNNIMTGDGNGSFRPSDNITREEFVKVILTALKIRLPDDLKPSYPGFDDVLEDAWYYDYVVTAYHYNIVMGIDKSSFGTGRPINRQDAATLIMRVRDFLEKPFVHLGDAVAFADDSDIADYAAEAVRMLQKAGVLNGYEDGEFKPENNITRAETAKIIYSFLLSIGSL